MHNLSIFVDESGDFGEYQPHSPYYIVTMVIHEQDKDISSNIERINATWKYFDLQDDAIHTAPFIRREERLKVFYAQTLFHAYQHKKSISDSISFRYES